MSCDEGPPKRGASAKWTDAALDRALCASADPVPPPVFAQKLVAQITGEPQGEARGPADVPAKVPFAGISRSSAPMRWLAAGVALAVLGAGIAVIGPQLTPEQAEGTPIMAAQDAPADVIRTDGLPQVASRDPASRAETGDALVTAAADSVPETGANPVPSEEALAALANEDTAPPSGEEPAGPMVVQAGHGTEGQAIVGPVEAPSPGPSAPPVYGPPAPTGMGIAGGTIGLPGSQPTAAPQSDPPMRGPSRGPIRAPGAGTPLQHP